VVAKIKEGSMRHKSILLSHTLAVVLVGIVTTVVILFAQTTSTGPIMRFTATSDNVTGAGDAIRIDLLRWSTDAERDQFLTAWTSPGAAAAATRGGPAAGGRGAAARGGAEPAAGEPPAAGAA